MKELRCKKCNKLLGKYNGDAEIKCTRCKTMNQASSVYDEFESIGMKPTK